MKDYKLKQRNLRASHTLGWILESRKKTGEKKKKQSDPGCGGGCVRWFCRRYLLLHLGFHLRNVQGLLFHSLHRRAFTAAHALLRHANQGRYTHHCSHYQTARTRAA